MSSYSTSQDQMSVASTATASSAGAIPDILKIGTMDSNTQIEIETDVLCRWEREHHSISVTEQRYSSFSF